MLQNRCCPYLANRADSFYNENLKMFTVCYLVVPKVQIYSVKRKLFQNLYPIIQQYICYKIYATIKVVLLLPETLKV